MNGSLVPGKWLAGALGVIIIVGFISGHLFWDKHPYACIDGKHWSGGPWYTAFSVYHLEVRFHAYGCPESERYDPTKVNKETNIYTSGGVPIIDSSQN